MYAENAQFGVKKMLVSLFLRKNEFLFGVTRINDDRIMIFGWTEPSGWSFSLVVPRYSISTF